VRAVLGRPLPALRSAKPVSISCFKQVTQLSQRDRATAAWVGFGQKCKRIFCRQ